MGRNCWHKENIPRRFFSLVEMLVVMVIIAILVAAGAGGYTVARRWMAQSKTEALLAKLKIALEAYKNDKGYYPLPNNNTPVNFRLDVNVNDYADLDPSGYSSHLPSPDDHLQPRNNMSSFLDYAELRHEQSLKVEQAHYYEYFVKDGWNTPANGESYGAIKYRCPGAVNTTSFDLYSAGPDRVFNTEDDIYVKF
jgi:prepilin-type N-terminal cleavage/methylation domain-containing protein